MSVPQAVVTNANKKRARGATRFDAADRSDDIANGKFLPGLGCIIFLLRCANHISLKKKKDTTLARR